MKQTLAATIALLLVAAPGLGADGGGSVLNVLELVSLSGSLATANDTTSHPESWVINILDENGLSDIESVTISGSNENATNVWSSTLTPTLGNWIGGNGWTVNTASPSGQLTLTYARTWTASDYASGLDWNITATVTDDGGLSRAEDDATLFVQQAIISIASGLFDSECDLVTSPWTGWTAAPNETDVFEPVWIRLVNTGTKAGQASIAWQEDDFERGLDDVPIDGNIRYVTATTSTSGCPENATPATGPIDADGSTIVSVPSKQRLWVSYQLDALPTPLPAGQYLASYTVQVIP